LLVKSWWEASVKLPLPENEGARLESLHSFRILETACEQIFDDILRLATLICDTPLGKIGFVDEQRVWLKAKIGFDFDEIPRERSFSAHAILRSDVLLVPDPLADATFANNFLVTKLGVNFFCRDAANHLQPPSDRGYRRDGPDAAPPNRGANKFLADSCSADHS
jgi:hypothetical protein